MTENNRARALKAKYGDSYFSDIAKQVKHRQGFHTRGAAFARAAQAKAKANKAAKMRADEANDSSTSENQPEGAHEAQEQSEAEAPTEA